MKKSFRGVVLIIIAIIAFIASALSILSLVLVAFDIVKEYGFDFKSVGIELLIYSGIDLIFVVMEISFAKKLITAVKENEHFKTYEMISGLVTSILLPMFTIFITNIVFAFVFKTKLETLDIAFLILFFIAMSVLSFIRPVMLRRNLVALDFIMLISSLLNIVIFILNYKEYFILTEEMLFDTLSNAINFIMLVMLSIFSLVSLLYYLKNPSACAVEEREHEDVDVIETFDNYEVVKLYSYRGVDNKKTKTAHIVSIIGCFLAIIFSILFFIENGFHLTLKEDINNLIGIFSLSSSGSFFDAMFYMIKIIVPVSLFSYALNYLFGIFTKSAQYKTYSIYMVNSSINLLTVTFYARLISVASAYLYKNFDFSELTFMDALILVIFIAETIARRTFKHSIKSINDGIKHGQTFHEQLGKIVPMNITNGIIGILCIIVYGYYNYLQSGKILLSLILLVIVNIFIIVGCCIENKNPSSEYVKLKRKRIVFKIFKNKQETN